MASRIYKPLRGLAKWPRGFTNPFRGLVKWVREFTNPFRDPASPSRDFARPFERGLLGLGRIDKANNR